MDKMTMPTGAPHTDAECKLIIDHYLSEIKRMNMQIAEDHREIETLRGETDAILNDIMQTLKAA